MSERDDAPWGSIEVRGAREHNLRTVSLDIPKRRLTVFTGVSGSGKSSLVFQTLAAESRRLLNETYSSFVQTFMGTPARPDVDELRNLSPAIVVDQERMGANARSTVGTVTDAAAMLRILFSRLGEPHIGSPEAFSYNVPSVTASGTITIERGGRRPVRPADDGIVQHYGGTVTVESEGDGTRTERRTFRLQGGMCPRCEGLGTAQDFDRDELYDASKSLAQGALRVPGYSSDGWYGRIFRASGFFDPAKPIRDFSPQELHDLLYREPVRIKVEGINVTYEGLIPRITKSMLSKDREGLQPHVRAFVDRAVTFRACPDCGGSRLNEVARSSKVRGLSIADAAAMQISDLAGWIRALDDPGVAPLVHGLAATLDGFVEIGLGYLSLDRASGTLSGGEAQRTRMVRHLGSPLTDMTYVFDEPTIGLHAHDVDRMNTLLRRLRDKGNTVLVVEHDPAVIAIADHVVDMGPGAGPHGGTIVYEGTVDGLATSGTATGRHLSTAQGLKDATRRPAGTIPIRDARLHNLRGVSVDVPLGVLVAVTGVAGSGKSSLIHGCLPRTDPPVVFIDQSAIRGSRRSNPATYTGILDPIRKAFASATGAPASLFSANSEGACPACNGLGMIYTDLGFMAEVASVCEACEGRRFTDDVLVHRLRGRNIVEVLAMPVEEAAAFFTEKPVRTMLRRLADVGLGYVALGQELDTLSGGERQRLKLAIEMAGSAPVFVLDEPTTGLHMQDVDALIGLLDRLVDGGRTVIVIEHNLDVVARADWVIDLGPGGGHDGGTLVFEGTPADLVRADASLTGLHLRRRLEASAT